MDAGNYFSQRLPEEGLINDFMYQTLPRVQLSVINLAVGDLHLWQKLAEASPGTQFVTANFKILGRKLPAPPPYALVPVSRPHGTLRLAFVGLADNPGEQLRGSDFTWVDPVTALVELMPELKAKSDFIVILGDISRSTAAMLALRFPEIRLEILAETRFLLNPPEEVNNALITQAVERGRYLGQMEMMFKDGTLKFLASDFIPLSGDAPEASDILPKIASLQSKLADFQKVYARQSAQAAVGSGDFVGAEKCRPCHAAAFDVWSKSQHAHAVATLAVRNAQNDNRCLPCHTTGFGKPGGFYNNFATPQMQNVQCEACHGPGRQHLAQVKTRLASGSAVCATCHTPGQTPDFEFERYWPKIRH
ncbi:MAG TPA: multiheme c-type cytochrome [Acidobacteriota bacterium]